MKNRAGGAQFPGDICQKVQEIVHTFRRLRVQLEVETSMGLLSGLALEGHGASWRSNLSM